jgi:hypothetical protein
MDTSFGSIITAFLLGIFSTAHCIAMCGSVIGALTLSLPREIREQPRRMLPFVTNYNIGRILSYGMAGLVVGLLSAPLTQLNAHVFLQVLSAIVMIGMGLYLTGWWPAFARIEKFGIPIWHRLQPLGQRFLPVKSKSQAFFLGMVWGWLPCGLVYSALAVAATTGDPLAGSLTMLAFGLGTLPAVMSAGMFTGILSAFARSQFWRKTAGMVIILMALLSLIGPFWIDADNDHHRDAAPVGTEQAHGH